MVKDLVLLKCWVGGGDFGPYFSFRTTSFVFDIPFYLYYRWRGGPGMVGSHWWCRLGMMCMER